MIHVLNEHVVDLLATANQAVRALRGMGYRVISQDLAPARGNKPEVRIDCRNKSIDKLLHNTQCRRWMVVTDKKRGYADFADVTVTWEVA